MSTLIRPEISKKNQYWIDKHRYYELKHFCLQYNYWKEKLKQATENAEYYRERIHMVDRIAASVDETLGRYILKAVTEEISYEALNAKYNLHCSKDAYYDLYRKFFWILHCERK